MSPNPNKRTVDGMIIRNGAQPKPAQKQSIPVSKPTPKPAVKTTTPPIPKSQPVAKPKPAVQKNPAISKSSEPAKAAVQAQPAPSNPNQPPITGWNWGAFLLSWIWGIGNHVWIALLVLIPIAPINLIIAIYLGLKGNELAWRAKDWQSPEQFIETQRKWAKWGVIVLILAAVAVLAIVVLLALTASSNTSSY